jgi:hypothetical protein
MSCTTRPGRYRRPITATHVRHSYGTPPAAPRADTLLGSARVVMFLIRHLPRQPGRRYT